MASEMIWKRILKYCKDKLKPLIKPLLRNSILREFAYVFFDIVKGNINIYINYLITRKKIFRDNLSVTAIIKNEGAYIKEWIEYHKIVGVERFYIYDNYSSDTTKNILMPYINSGEVVYTLFPDKNIFSVALQIAAYNDAIKRYKNCTKWMAIIDVDEFIVPVYSDCDSIIDILKKNERRCGIVVPWVLYGYDGNYDKPNGLVIENYSKSCDKTKLDVLPSGCGWIKNDFFQCKSIVNPRMVVYGHVHYCRYLFGKSSMRMNKNEIRINHYWTKSYKELCERMNRNKTGFSENEKKYAGINKYDPNFLSHNEETIMKKYISQLKKNLSKVEQQAAGDCPFAPSTGTL